MYIRLTLLAAYCSICTISALAQQQELRDIIASNSVYEQKKNALDSFFNVTKEVMDPQELAECYHDFAFRWFYKVIWNNEQNPTGLDSAISYYEKAASIKRTAQNTDATSLKRTLYNLGITNTLNNQSFKAIKAFTELVNIPEVDNRTLNGYRELGKAYATIGDYYRALGFFEKLITSTYGIEGYEQKLLMGYYRKADTYFNMDIKGFSKEIQSALSKADSVGNLPSWEGPRLRNEIRYLEGIRLLKIEAYGEAISYFKQIIEKINPTDLENLAIVNNSLGNAYLLAGDHSNAEQFLEKSVLLDPEMNAAYENMGDLFQDIGNFDKATSCYQKAISIAIGQPKANLEIKNLQLSSTPKKYDLLHHLIRYGNALLLQFHENQNQSLLNTALKQFEIADRLVDIIRFESYEVKSKLYWREKSAALYLSAVEACFLLDKPVLAYYFMEKNKGILLLEDISENKAIESANIPEEIVSKELAFKKRILATEQALIESQQGNTTQNEHDVTTKSLLLLKSGHEQFLDSIITTFPLYASLKKKVKILPYSQLKKDFIDDQSGIMHYIIGNDIGFGLLSTKTDTTIFKIKEIPQLQKEIQQLLISSQSVLTTKDTFESYQTLANSIYTKVFPQNFNMPLDAYQLTIVPDQNLQLISFETLMSNKKYLIKNFEIKYAYSISHLHENSHRDRNASSGFVGFAPERFSGRKLANLPNSVLEVNELQAITQGLALIKEDATKSSFFEHSNNHKVVHLSTHADLGKREQPWVAFADADMSLNELYTSSNQAEMVVLSACNTSLGSIKTGEGIMSLARGFINAGANSVVSSLWPTNDLANLELMSTFYLELDNGKSKSAALRVAKLKYLQTHTGTEVSPYYWGSLILTGNGESLSFNGHNSFELYKYYILSILLLIVCVFLARKIRKQV